MKYHILDDDNAVTVCATDSRKEAFTAILNHLIEANASEVHGPLLWPVPNLARPEDQMPDVNAISQDAWSVIRQAQAAYERITTFIPMS